MRKNWLKAIDSLPLAYAKATPSDDFITPNHRFIYQGQSLNLPVMNSADFILEMDDENK